MQSQNSIFFLYIQENLRYFLSIFSNILQFMHFGLKNAQKCFIIFKIHPNKRRTYFYVAKDSFCLYGYFSKIRDSSLFLFCFFLLAGIRQCFCRSDRPFFCLPISADSFFLRVLSIAYLRHHRALWNPYVFVQAGAQFYLSP